MRKLKILLDLDDVLDNQCEVWTDYLNRRYYEHVRPIDIKDWDMRKAYPNLTESEIYEPVHSGRLVEEMKAPNHVEAYTSKWVALGHELYVVSATNTRNAQQKKLWLTERYPWFTEDKLILCSHKELIYGDVFIDDGAHNIIVMDERGANPECICICLDKPWNREKDVPIRAKTWADIDAIIKELEREVVI